MCVAEVQVKGHERARVRRCAIVEWTGRKRDRVRDNVVTARGRLRLLCWRSERAARDCVLPSPALYILGTTYNASDNKTVPRRWSRPREIPRELRVSDKNETDKLMTETQYAEFTKSL